MKTIKEFLYVLAFLIVLSPVLFFFLNTVNQHVSNNPVSEVGDSEIEKENELWRKIYGVGD